MKRGIAFLLVLVFYCLRVTGHHIMLEKANTCYQNGNYKQASIWYQQLIDEGFQNAALYYNAGNAYFRNKQIGLAIKNYRLSLNEKSNTLAYDNLVIARKAVTIPVPVITTFSTTLRNTFEQLDINTYIISSIFFFIGFILWIILKLLNRVNKNKWGVFWGLLYLISTIGMSAAFYYQVKTYPMVVVASKIEFKSTIKGGRKFVYDGTEVHYINEQGNNTLVELPNGEKGWVASSALAKCN